jgi:hypothetical protein
MRCLKAFVGAQGIMHLQKLIMRCLKAFVGAQGIAPLNHFWRCLSKDIVSMKSI